MKKNELKISFEENVIIVTTTTCLSNVLVFERRGRLQVVNVINRLDTFIAVHAVRRVTMPEEAWNNTAFEIYTAM